MTTKAQSAMTVPVSPAVSDGFLPLGGVKMTDDNLLSWVGTKGRGQRQDFVSDFINLLLKLF